jgi:hypothetical protein
LLDLTEKFGTKGLFVVAHLPASQENSKRLSEIYNIVNFVKSTKNNQTSLKIEKNSPVFIFGDMNLVGFSEQLRLLLTGSTDGLIQDIDWDNTSFAESSARLTESPFCYTWTKAVSYYWPGKLDYLIYSDFASQLKKSFSINTLKMSNDILEKYNLKIDDSQLATDHLPIISDFKITDFNSLQFESDNKEVYYFQLENEIINNSDANFEFKVYDLLGKAIWNGTLMSHSSYFFPNLTKGNFFIMLNSGNYNSKPVIIRAWNSE